MKNNKMCMTEQDYINDVTLLDSFYFTEYFKAKEKKAIKVVEKVSSEFELNEEQERAFRIAANHAIEEDPPQLKMYLGGVGGTGKSQAILSYLWRLSVEQWLVYYEAWGSYLGNTRNSKSVIWFIEGHGKARTDFIHCRC
ncbi:hypothetical protein FB451DRAFT_1312984 [Mycena latifolia]|nr:hypothetical protein FB451DRAFT_1312984 [Mycena latifolia]